MKPTLALNMIVKNEENLLKDCLSSICDIVDEIVIVDTGSTDQTKEIAKSFHAKIIDFKWIDDFSAARNCAIENTKSDWILSLDADEFVPETSKHKLKNLKETLNSKENSYYLLRVLLKNNSAINYQSRLFIFPNREDVRWKFRVHEQINKEFKKLGIKSIKKEIEIHNQGREEDRLKKAKYYRDILKEELEKYPEEANILFHLGKEYYVLEDYKKAVIYLDKAMDFFLDESVLFEDAAFHLTSSLYLTGRFTEAWSALKNARKVYPRNLLLLHFEASLYRFQKKMNLFESAFLEIIYLSENYDFTELQLPPKSARISARLILAELYKEQKREKEAKKMWELILVDDPKNQIALNELKKRTE